MIRLLCKFSKSQGKAKHEKVTGQSRPESGGDLTIFSEKILCCHDFLNLQALSYLAIDREPFEKIEGEDKANLQNKKNKSIVDCSIGTPFIMNDRDKGHK